MKIMVAMSTPRLYHALLAEHYAGNRQMAFVSGPRQVGKTTTCRQLADAYVNWDDLDGRDLVLAGPARLVDALRLDRLREKPPLVLFDELHKFPRWKQFLKGLFDTHGDKLRIALAGSSRLDVYRRGGDSLMGRYFRYRMHPFSTAEALAPRLPDAAGIVGEPRRIDAENWAALWLHGGFPEPFLRRDARFSRRWRTLRQEQLLREDVRDLTNVQQLGQLEMVAAMLAAQSGQQLVYGRLANQARVAVDTARRWVATLCDLHVGFLLRPWHRNVARSLRKEPKWYLGDWATVQDVGQRAETFVACHLRKAVDGWNDLGLGAFELGYLRDKEKREVDFVVVRDGRPWFLVEAKRADVSPSPALAHFQRALDAPFAFQATMEADYVDVDCFARPGPPLVVPARTLLSQLL